MTRITGKDNPRIVSAGRLKLKKYRDETGSFIISGKKLVKEALSSGVTVKEAFICERFVQKDKEFSDTLTAACGERSVYLISDGLAGKLTDEESPEGVFCVCEKPALEKYEDGRFVAVLDRIADPGNVGTVLRSARAFGAHVVLSSDCADIYSPKVLRAAMGAVFSRRLSFTRDVIKTVSDLRKDGYTVYAAALCEDAVPLSEVSLCGRSAVVIGNEGSGLSREVIDACDSALIIEMEKESESLNAAVAASVIMYRAYKGN